MGHTIHSWCPDSASQSYLPLDSVVPETIIPLKKKISLNEKIFRTFGYYYNRVIKTGREIEEHCRQCAAVINNQDFDVLFVSPCRWTHIPPIGRYVNIPKVFFFPEPARYLYEARPAMPWAAPMDTGIFNRLFSYIKHWIKIHFLGIQTREEYRNIKSYNSICVNSIYTRETLKRLYGLRGNLCYPCVDTQEFTYQGKDRSNFVIGVGSFQPSKNIEFVIRALAEIKEKRPHLIWVGNSKNEKYFEELVELAEMLDVDFRPRLLVPDKELICLLNTATLMVYSPNLEPLGLAPLEANACALPVVAVAEAGTRETVVHEKTGLLTENNEESFAKAVSRLLDNPGLARRLGENGRKHVKKNWSWEKSNRKLENILRNTISRSMNR